MMYEELRLMKTGEEENELRRGYFGKMLNPEEEEDENETDEHERGSPTWKKAKETEKEDLFKAPASKVIGNISKSTQRKFKDQGPSRQQNPAIPGPSREQELTVSELLRDQELTIQGPSREQELTVSGPSRKQESNKPDLPNPILPGAVSILGPNNPNLFNGNLAYARHPPSTSESKHSKVAEVPSLETNGTNSLDKNFGLDPSSSDDQNLATREFSYKSSLLDSKDEALFKTSVSKTHEANVGIKSSDLFKEDGVDDKLFIKPKSSPLCVGGLSEPILNIFKESAIQKPLSLFEDSDSGEEELLFSSTSSTSSKSRRSQCSGDLLSTIADRKLLQRKDVHNDNSLFGKNHLDDLDFDIFDEPSSQKLTHLKTKSLRPSPSIHNQNKMAINLGEVLVRTNPPTEKTKPTEAAVNFDKPARIDSILHSAGKDRAKIPIKRRPQSRQARQEALRKDPSEDYVFDDSTLTFPKHSDSSTLEVVVEDFTDSIKKKNDFEATRQVSLISLDNTSNEVTINNRVVEAIPENLLTSPGSLVLNRNTNPLSPSTDEEDFFGVPQYLPSEYGSNKDLIADSNKDLFGDAPMLSPLDFSERKTLFTKDVTYAESSKIEMNKETPKLFYKNEISSSQLSLSKNDIIKDNFIDDSKSDIVTGLERKFKNDDDDDANLQFFKTVKATLADSLVTIEITQGEWTLLNFAEGQEALLVVIGDTLAIFKKISINWRDIRLTVGIHGKTQLDSQKNSKQDSENSTSLSEVFSQTGNPKSIDKIPTLVASCSNALHGNLDCQRQEDQGSIPDVMPAVISFLEEAIEKTGEALVKAKGLYHSIMSFQFILALEGIVQVMKFTLPFLVKTASKLNTETVH
ncbi:unnamed protein product [Timema podura]|uniref:FAM21/CAPZIP domain-containing protein n=1 Tax=Timema podura TaxID=61482 RepID=A0ABN7NAZ2_TIMPD|nr:unnamed protein product [Timema podura]